MSQQVIRCAFRASMQVAFGDDMLGRVFNGSGDPSMVDLV